MGGITVGIGTPLAGSIDPETEAALVPEQNVVKGMFFASMARILGDDLNDVLPTLAAPPPKGRYFPFKDYPQSDYVRVSCAAAAKQYPGVELREGMRRLGRSDFGTFTDSTLGRVIMAMVRDARSALYHAPTVYQRVAPGKWVISAKDLDADTVRVRFEHYPTDWAYTLGQLEGVVMHYGHDPETTITEDRPAYLCFDVRHTA